MDSSCWRRHHAGRRGQDGPSLAVCRDINERASYSTTPRKKTREKKNPLVHRVDGQQTRVEIQKDDPESVYHRPDPLRIKPCALYPPEVDIASNLSAPSGVKQQRAQSTDPIFKQGSNFLSRHTGLTTTKVSSSSSFSFALMPQF